MPIDVGEWACEESYPAECGLSRAIHAVLTMLDQVSLEVYRFMVPTLLSRSYIHIVLLACQCFSSSHIFRYANSLYGALVVGL